jgi:hypothetical protein
MCVIKLVLIGIENVSVTWSINSPRFMQPENLGVNSSRSPESSLIQLIFSRQKRILFP